ncbi:hypothetical protein T07_1027 [Trichinella nelsoni]|uniref:Uncharacterized protein n=1 Tax=Trichinella nelsoni TaxID=6336 RepID=A0A0V0RVK2_9BILA|nr:hypothetical protein T07_1027 [Trichinella nelsoni]
MVYEMKKEFYNYTIYKDFKEIEKNCRHLWSTNRPGLEVANLTRLISNKQKPSYFASAKSRAKISLIL